ncbi:MAG: hypothetical protein IJZ55_13185 [Lachnospiraceae bacterium]|nr:hypothetical protein [Lachnospiraceae bacterium]
MTEDTISKLPEVLTDYMATLKRTSKDETNAEFMTESTLRVVHFDKLPQVYARGKGWRAVPKSNDALYVDGDKWFFIEFKNGTIKRDDIYRKIYDSLIMLIELGAITGYQFSRDNIDYILVYNSDKYSKCQESASREKNFSYIMSLAQKEEKLFDLELLEGYLFHEVHTYTKEMFQEKFVSVMEGKEYGSKDK